MSRQLMFLSLPLQLLLLFVLLSCSNSCTVHAEKSQSQPILFEAGKTEMLGVSGNPEDKKVFESFLAPSLVEKNGVVVAFAEAFYKGANDTVYTGLVTKSTKDAGKTWSDGNAMIKNAYDFKTFRMVYPTPVVDDQGVTVVMGGYGDWGVPLTKSAGCYHWKLWSGWGEFKSTDDTEDNGMFLLNYDLTNIIKENFYTLEKTPYLQFIGGGSPGLKMKNGKYVFPFQALKSETEKNVSLVMYSGSTTHNLKLSTYATQEDCSTPAIAEYEGKKLFMMTSCGGGYRKVYDAYFEGQWKDGVGTLSGVWGNSLKRQWYGVQGGFITAAIDGKEVVLVSLPVYTAESNEKEKGRLHLWLSDLDRVLDLGPISKETENAAASSLLYTPPRKENDNKGKLYCSYAAAPSVSSDKYNVVFLDLADKLEMIKNVLRSWEGTDKYVLGTQDGGKVTGLHSSDAEYNSNNRTHGPIGFLSNRFADGQWKDEYFCVNATVKGHVRTDYGLEFKGIDGGAVWPVGRMGQNQPYYFAKHGFTLLATVTIKAVPTGNSIPLMGVNANNEEKSLLFGLSYTKDKKWVLVLNNGSEIPVEKAWSEDTEYHVALQMKSDQLTLYINGEEVHKRSLDGTTRGLCRVHGLSHFYIGADDKNTKGESDIHLAVKNVLLYKRQLTAEEIKKIKENTDKPAPQLENEEEVKGPYTKDPVQDTGRTEHAEKDQSPKKKQQP